MWTVILDKIYDILNSNKADNKLQEIYRWEADRFNGSPACTITPSENVSDYNTTETNIRIYAFVIRVYVNIKKHDASNAERILRESISKILDDFDKDYLFDGLVVPTGYTMVNTFAMPSAWGYAEREDIYRVGEVTLRARVAVNLNQVS